MAARSRILKAGKKVGNSRGNRKRGTGKLHHIARHHASVEKGLGWEVAVNRRGRIFREHFADSLYGSKAKALKTAMQFRDALLKELPPAAAINFRQHNNTSGVIGVRHVKTNKRTKTFESFVAFWPTKSGRAKSRKFGVVKYGYEGAFELAKEAREQGLLAEFGPGPLIEQCPSQDPLLKKIGKRLSIKHRSSRQAAG